MPSDYREAIKLYAQAPLSYNDFAWITATKEVPDRKLLQKDALSAAERAIAIARKPGYLDTLACVHALVGNFPQAIMYQSEPAAEEPRNTSFQERPALFKTQKDCSGVK